MTKRVRLQFTAELDHANQHAVAFEFFRNAMGSPQSVDLGLLERPEGINDFRQGASPWKSRAHAASGLPLCRGLSSSDAETPRAFASRSAILGVRKKPRKSPRPRTASRERSRQRMTNARTSSVSGSLCPALVEICLTEL